MKDLEIKANYDLFSKEISLYFRGSGYYSTLFGKIATFAYITFYFILLVYYSLLGIFKKEGTVTSEETITKELPNLTLSKNNLYFAYALEDPITYDNIRDDEIYYTEAYYKHGKRIGENWIWEQKKLEVGPCEVEYFGEKYQEQFLLKPYKTFTCIKNLKENLFGHFVYDDYSFIYIQFFPCVNDTIHHCKPQEIIDKYLNGTFIDLQMQSALINSESYEDPVQENFEDVYTTVGRGFKRELHIYYKVMNFKDYGFFGERLGEKKYVQYDYNNPMATLNFDFLTNKSICDITIKLSDKTLIVKREYKTLMENYSKIGGIMDFILKIICAISFFLVSTLFDVSAINDIFQFYKKNKKILYNGIKKQNFFRVETFEYRNKDKNPNSESEFRNLKSIDERKVSLSNKRKNSKAKLNYNSSKNNCTIRTSVNDLNSKDYILNNIITNIHHINNNINDINNNDIIDDLNKKHNFTNEENKNNNYSINERKIIKGIKMNPFNLFLFSLFPNKLTNKNSILLKMGLRKFREELDVTKLFRVSLLNNRVIKVLKNNSSLLTFNEKDLIINTYRLYIE